MFCISPMIALIFISPTLCCAPSHACLCCILLSAAFIMCAYVSRLQAGFLSAFVRLLIHLLRIDVPSSHRLSFVHLCACHLHVDFHLFVILGTVHMWAGVFAY
jgi:hypothetical protein